MPSPTLGGAPVARGHRSTTLQSVNKRVQLSRRISSVHAYPACPQLLPSQLLGKDASRLVLLQLLLQSQLFPLGQELVQSATLLCSKFLICCAEFRPGQ